jgi:hypothetical protein
MTAFTLLFDRFGRPYTAYTDEITNVPLASQLTITISKPEPSGYTLKPG